MISPVVVKGGIVQLDPVTGRNGRVIALQYNPETITRTLAIQAAGDDPGQPMRLKGVAIETVRLEAEIDATDALAGSEATAVDVGIAPQLAALELLVQPTTATLRQNRSLAVSGMLDILPLQAPLALFVWSRNRVVPVRVTELSIVEQAYDARLNPIRAKVTLGLRVLTVDDLGYDQVGGTVSFGHMQATEVLAGRARSAALSALGVEAL